MLSPENIIFQRDNLSFSNCFAYKEANVGAEGEGRNGEREDGK